MTWFAVARVLVGILANIIAHMREKKLIDLGAAQEIAKQLEASNAILDKARRARDDATADFDKRGGVPDDKDPNLRD